MFIDNKYTGTYFRLVEQARSRSKLEGYREQHHIIPRCLGGSDDPSNLVALTAREHFICHRLLTKMVGGYARHQMDFALFCLMTCRRNRHLSYNSRLFEQARVAANHARSILMKDRPKSEEAKEITRQAALRRVYPPTGPHSEERKRKISQSLKGNQISAETRRKISEANTGQKRTEETKRRISESNRGKVVIITEATKAKISQALKGRPSPMLGREGCKTLIHSEESKAKMSNSHQNRPMVTCLKCRMTVQYPTFIRWHGDRCSRPVAEGPSADRADGSVCQTSSSARYAA